MAYADPLADRRLASARSGPCPTVASRRVLAAAGGVLGGASPDPSGHDIVGSDPRVRTKASLDPPVAAHLLFATSRFAGAWCSCAQPAERIACAFACRRERPDGSDAASRTDRFKRLAVAVQALVRSWRSRSA